MRSSAARTLEPQKHRCPGSKTCLWVLPGLHPQLQSCRGSHVEGGILGAPDPSSLSALPASCSGHLRIVIASLTS